MANIDEILKTKVKPPAEGGGSSDANIDSFLQEQEKLKIREAKESKIDTIISENRKKSAENEAQRRMIVTSSNPVDYSVAVSPNAQSALLKTLIDSGTDPAKAASFLNSLDQETLARLLLLSGGGAGSSSLVPLLLLSRQPQSQITDLVSAARSITEMVQPKQGGGFKEYTDAFATVADIFDKRKGDEGSSSIREEIAAMRQSLESEREARHQTELNHQKEIAEMRTGQLQDQLQGIQGELENLKNRDLAAEVEKAKKTLEGLGFKMTTGGREDLDTIKELTKTVTDSPAFENLTSALGDRIRTGGGMRGPRQSASATPMVTCDVCAQRGVKTMLPVTPEIQAGKADLVCPVCGTTFTKD